MNLLFRITRVYKLSKERPFLLLGYAPERQSKNIFDVLEVSAVLNPASALLLGMFGVGLLQSFLNPYDDIPTIMPVQNKQFDSLQMLV